MKDSSLSSLFLNIDGNKSNFDSFAVNIRRIWHKFSVIGLAETNVDPQNKDLFRLDGYNSFYQDIQPGKGKGTGVALYVHDSLNATMNKRLSHTSPNLETLFVTIPVDSQNFTFGVLYRPPSGNFDNFLSELKFVLEGLPRPYRNLYLMGDYNIDLHRIEYCENHKTYEEMIITAGLFPLISLHTHQAHDNCRKTCIDNILTNSPGDVVFTGTVGESPSKHLPIFQFSNSSHVSDIKEPITQFYDFKSKNIDTFVTELEEALLNELPDDSNFSEFIKLYNKKIDQNFKLEKPRTTKRNCKNNPWITEGLLESINKKAELFDNWNKSKTKENSRGDERLHTKFSDYRRTLKHAIAAAKSRYNCKKISEYEGDSKKTWSIINNLRGKSKNSIKPQFIIDNKRITDRRIIANEFNRYFVSIAMMLLM